MVAPLEPEPSSFDKTADHGDPRKQGRVAVVVQVLLGDAVGNPVCCRTFHGSMLTDRACIPNLNPMVELLLSMVGYGPCPSWVSPEVWQAAQLCAEAMPNVLEAPADEPPASDA